MRTLLQVKISSTRVVKVGNRISREKWVERDWGNLVNFTFSAGKRQKARHAWSSAKNVSTSRVLQERIAVKSLDLPSGLTSMNLSISLPNKWGDRHSGGGSASDQKSGGDSASDQESGGGSASDQESGRGSASDQESGGGKARVPPVSHLCFNFRTTSPNFFAASLLDYIGKNSA